MAVVGNGDGSFTWTGEVDTLINGARLPDRLPVLVKMSGQGQIIWSRAFHAPPGRTGVSSMPLPLLRTPDGYVVGANTLDFVNPTGNAFLDRQTVTKFDNLGRIQWEVRFPGYAANTQNLFVQANGSYVAAGYELVPTPLTTSFSESLDARLVEFTHTGDTIRTKRFGVEGDYEAIQKAVPTADKGVVMFVRRRARLPAGSPTEQRLVKLDSLWRVQWNVPVDTSPNPYLWDLSVTAAGEYLLVGSRQLAGRETGYLARFSVSGQRLAFLDVAASLTAATSLRRLVHEPGDPLMAWGAVQIPRPPAPGMPTSSQRTFSAGFGNVAPAFVPDYCRYPPQPNAIYAQPQPDSLVLRQLSGAGPRYAQNVSYRWELGDGTVLERATGGLVRHRYAAGRVPGPGTAVRLTLTNNLGCTATQALYPWGRPTAAQQARAWAGRATLWPNPATGTATLGLAEAPAGGATVQVLDALGRVVQTHALPAGATALVLEVGALPAGVYAVRVSTAAGSFAKRLVRQ